MFSLSDKSKSPVTRWKFYKNFECSTQRSLDCSIWTELSGLTQRIWKYLQLSFREEKEETQEEGFCPFLGVPSKTKLREEHVFLETSGQRFLVSQHQFDRDETWQSSNLLCVSVIFSFNWYSLDPVSLSDSQWVEIN